MTSLRNRAASALLVVAVLLRSSSAQTTVLVSWGLDGHSANGFSVSPSMSSDGRFVVFASNARDLLPRGGSGDWQVFVRDRLLETTELVGLSAAGTLPNGWCRDGSSSADGRYIAFESDASNLVPGDSNGTSDVYLRDRIASTTERISVGPGGADTDGASAYPSISADGRYVAFWSEATNIVSGDSNGAWDVFVRDRVAGTTELVSVSSRGVQGNGASGAPAISADGRFIVFESGADNLVPGDSNGKADIFVRDRLLRTTSVASIATNGAWGNKNSYSASISADGRYVAFLSDANDLVPGDGNQRSDVFVRDLAQATTERVSVASDGSEGNENSGYFQTSISGDGRFVVFESDSTNLVPGDVNGFGDIFVHDRVSGTTECVSLSMFGGGANGESTYAAVSANGRYVAFESNAPNLVPNDTNSSGDIFLRDRDTAAFPSLCQPGHDGIRDCPCANAPSSSGRGCDNAAGTGGARLAASGRARLSADRLQFTSEGEAANALSTLVQAGTPTLDCAIYGHGLSCVYGAVLRLCSRSAIVGGITFPDANAGDPSVSARSAALGDRIQPGTLRWYFVVYRDEGVVGSCSRGRALNTTQVRQVTWAP
jgi:Tol biopolymer transport system component